MYCGWTRRTPATAHEVGEQRFEITVDLSRTAAETLDVYYDPDDVHISVELSNGDFFERTFAAPPWSDTKTATAVLNNGILTITVTER